MVEIGRESPRKFRGSALAPYGQAALLTCHSPGRGNTCCFHGNLYSFMDRFASYCANRLPSVLPMQSWARASEYIHCSSRQKRDHYQRNQRLNHHQHFGPTRHHRCICRREGCAGIEGQEQGPLINSDEGKAAYSPPMATDAVKAGERGSAFCGLRVGCISPNRSIGESIADYLYL